MPQVFLDFASEKATTAIVKWAVVLLSLRKLPHRFSFFFMYLLPVPNKVSLGVYEAVYFILFVVSCVGAHRVR